MNVVYRYLDIIWLDNLIMNFIILWATLKLSKNESHSWRIWLSAAIGATYAVVLFLPTMSLLKKLPAKIVLSLIMLGVGFKFNDLKHFIKTLLVFYIATFVFGGAAIGLYYFFDDTILIYNGAFYIQNYPAKTLILSSFVVIGLFRMVWVAIRSHLSQGMLLYRLKINFEGQGIDLDALLDTGNTLYDPISHHPVVVVEFQMIKSMMPEQINEIFAQSLENNFEAIIKSIAESSWATRFRMIPFSSLGKPNGMIIGFKPDKICILLNKTWEEITDVVIGVYSDRLSKNGQYQALLNPGILL